jgi:hypothetical protein
VYVRLDVHKDSITVAYAIGMSEGEMIWNWTSLSSPMPSGNDSYAFLLSSPPVCIG